MVKALIRLGWEVARQSGSHAVLVKAGRTPVTVPVHARTMKLGTAKAILKQAGLAEDDFFDAY